MTRRDLRERFLALNAHGVESLIVGGYAVGAHSEPRATKDLDILIRTDEKNSVAVDHALRVFGAPVGDRTPEDFRNNPTSIFRIGTARERVDIPESIDGVGFDEAWQGKTESLIDGDIPTHAISREHLIRNKPASGRAEDIADVEALRKAAQHDQPKNGTPHATKENP